MKTAITLLAASVLTVLAITAKAATIENLDQAEYALRIIEDGQERRIALPPSQSANDLCKNVCELYVGTDPDPYELVSADKLVIEGGQLYQSGDIKPDSSTPRQ